MPIRLTRLWPTTLKNRLIAAFLLLILLPASAMNLYYFQETEQVLQQKVSEQSLEQLSRINRSLEDLLDIAFRTFILLEQDSGVTSFLKEPSLLDPLDRKSKLEEKFKAINNSLFIANPQVYYTVADLKGNVYTSYQPSEALNYAKIREEDWFREAMESEVPFRWKISPNHLHQDISKSPHLLTMNTVFRDNKLQPYAVAKISVDYAHWFKGAAKIQGESTVEQHYMLVHTSGLVVADSAMNERGQKIVHFPFLREGSANGYWQDDDSILIYSYLPSADWYLVKRVPVSVLFAEVNRLKHFFIIAFLLLTCAFVGMTFLISSTVTRPLKHLQHKMTEVVHKQFKIHLPEKRFKGEMLQLSRTFNQMVRDINDLVQRLKAEERKKETVHFRMLQSQTNPHFLLNTLNTIKWIAIGKEDQEIADICVALGKLLEAGLNSETELIYLKEEIELVQSYIAIQSFRFKQHIAVSYDYKPELEYALVPKLSLQPLVENSIVHGLARMKHQGRIQVRIYTQGNNLYVEVEDNGIGLKAARQQPVQRQGGGIGIGNLKDRLELLFKGKGGVQLEELRHGTLARFHLPLLLSTPYAIEGASTDENRTVGGR